MGHSNQHNTRPTVCRVLLEQRDAINMQPARKKKGHTLCVPQAAAEYWRGAPNYLQRELLVIRIKKFESQVATSTIF